MTSIGSDVLSDLARALRLEWLETDGLGGYACGTVVGANTRRYHGLLVAATEPPVGRRVLVSRLEETISYDDLSCDLSCNVYRDVIHPHGHDLLSEFRLDPWPVFTWRAEGAMLEKSVTMIHGQSLTIIRYHLQEAPRSLWLNVRPLVAGRDIHHLQRANVGLRNEPVPAAEGMAFQPYDPASRVVFRTPNAQFHPDGVWYYNFRYLHEEERGLDHIEDLFSPGTFSWLLHPGDTVYMLMGPGELTALDPAALLAQERERRTAIAQSAPDEVSSRLFLAADQFLVDRQAGAQTFKTVIAGYPWFGDWGRDTMIALPGLTLATGREPEALDCLRAFVSNMRDGLVPNNFGEGSGEPSFNTVDGTLWLFVACKRAFNATGDLDFIREVWPALRLSLSRHQEGTSFGIRMDEDGLLLAGDPGTQLTWMDAKVGDWVVTPRHGKAVEINALWYNAIKVGEFFAKKLSNSEEAADYGRLARLIRKSFEQFWSDDLGYCYDVLRPEGPDGALRPNQIIACALPYGLLDDARERSMLKAVGEQLLTPYGLRTLAPGSEGYSPYYRGDQLSRDGAYHQGTVWPWLLGPYLTAYFKVMGICEDTRRQARQLLQPLIEHLDSAGLGSISEIFDAEPPYAPQGCFAQAWSVSEVLRCWMDYRLGELE